MNETKLHTVTIIETEKKTKGYEKLKEGHLLRYFGVDSGQRAKEGVGCSINGRNITGIRDWKEISERASKLEIEKMKKYESTKLNKD